MTPENPIRPKTSTELVIQGRKVVPKPTKELRRLHARFEPDLFSNENILCNKSPENFIGALLLQKNISWLTQLYQTFNVQIPRFVSHSVELVANVPLSRSNKISDIIIPVTNTYGHPVILPKVLVRRGCGYISGLVMEGPYSGLILDIPYRDESSFVADKVFNDHSLIGSDKKAISYYPLKFRDERVKSYADLTIQKQYEELVRNHPMALDAFASLYSQVLGEEIDLQTFHRTAAV